MNKGTGTYIAIIVIAVLAVAVFFLADFSSSKTFASPEEVIKGMREASQKDDVRGWCQGLTDESRDLMAATVVLSEYFNKNDPDAPKELKAQGQVVEKIFESHGLTEAHLKGTMERDGMLLTGKGAPIAEKVKAARRILAPVQDRNSFVADIFKAIHQSPLDDWKNAKVSDVQIEGKMAMGVGTLARGPERFIFKKEGDSWRLDMVTMAEVNQRQMPKGFQHPPIDR